MDNNIEEKRIININNIKILCTEHCKIKDRNLVELKLNNLIIGGIHKLQLVSDFDYTITKQRLDNGEPVLTSFGMFNRCNSLPENFLDESRRLYHIYRPIEIDPHIETEQKIKSMIEWWSKSSDMLK